MNERLQIALILEAAVTAAPASVAFAGLLVREHRKASLLIATGMWIIYSATVWLCYLFL
jgi:hypothetical protein